VAGFEIEVLCHAAVAVWVIVESNHVSALPERACVVFAANAVVATVAREEEWERHSIAFFERSAE
jgi:hypothetical protein